VSNLRPLARVAREILFYRPCKRCERVFWYCRSREPGRLYCEACVEPAAEERIHRAQSKYRKSAEGLEQHRDEEAERRERQRERVGDRRLEGEGEQLQGPSTTSPMRSDEEESPDEPNSPEAEPVEWVVVAWPGVLEEAKQLLGTELECRGCGRLGVVVAVVSRDDWDGRPP
jgi:hypothetical protein